MTVGPPDIGDKEFSFLQNYVFEKAGITISNIKKRMVAGRLNKRLRYYDINNFSDYVKLIQKPENKNEHQIILDLLTTNETYFFREPKHFEFFKGEILKNRNSNGPMRVWSAASSSGQEAYTIAMIMAEHFGLSGWEILGTDISNDIIDKAKSALYPMTEAAKIPPSYLAEYCLKGVRDQEGLFLVHNNIKNKVDFKLLNLNGKLPEMGAFDVVFLRNVMIYFNNDVKKELVQKIIKKIKAGGYFIIGHSETLTGINTDVKMIKPSIYRKE